MAKGGDRLDAFGKKLYVTYTRNGFEPVSWTRFNEEYAPEEWKQAKSEGYDVQKEPVIFYKFTGKKTNLTYEQFLNQAPESSDYDEAQNARDKEL